MSFFNNKQQNNNNKDDKRNENLKGDQVDKIEKSEELGLKKEKTNVIENIHMHKILIKPLVTEKATDLTEFNQYIFEVNVNANKSEIKKAIKQKYNVDPINVNIIKLKPRKVRYGRSFGQTKKRKKAIIKLKKHDKIEIHEGV